LDRFLLHLGPRAFFRRVAKGRHEYMTNLNKVDVLDYLSTAVMVLTGDLRVCYLNSAAEALLGCSEGRSSGVHATELLNPEDVAIFEGFGSVVATGQSVTRRGEEFRTRDGHEIVADLTVSLEQVSGHLIVEFQPINRLIRINRDDHALFSQETTKKLVRGLAHEIKNPLGGVRGAAQLLERELEEARLKEYTRVIIDEADRLKSLVDRMLGPNREPEQQPVNVHSVIEHVIRLIDAQSRGSIAFQRDYDPSLPHVLADEAQLIQAILNIVANAAQALEDRPNPTISVRTRSVRQFTIGTAAAPNRAADRHRGQRPRHCTGHAGAHVFSDDQRPAGRHRPRPGHHSGHHRPARRHHRV
jgi:two-component system, NtrC family, nitrogen regulation sensor histidine kinase GlnL